MKAQDLKNSILQMAMEGKLVPQDPNDEPASVLLERIREEKEQLIKEKKIKRNNKESFIFRKNNHFYEKVGKNNPICVDGELFDIPYNWEWCTLSNILSVKGGKRVPKGYKLLDDPTPYIYIRVKKKKNGTIIKENLKYIDEEIHEEIKDYTIGKDDLYITVAGTIGDVGIVPDFFDGMNLTENANKLTDISINKEFLRLILMSDFVQTQLTKRTTKVAQPKLAIKRILSTKIPLPPLNEQKMIVNKLKELLPLIEQYNILDKNLNSLNAEFPNKIKDSILQEAIQGKLVHQDPDDEPANLLLERIREEKERLIKEKKIKRNKNESFIFKENNHFYEKVGKNEPICIDDGVLFEIPNNWQWCRMENIIQLISGRDMKSNEYNDNKKGIPYITGASNIENNNLIINRWIENPGVISIKNDILLTCKGTIGKLLVLNEPKVHIARQIMAIRIFDENLIFRDFVLLVLEYYVNKLQYIAKSMIPGISREDVLKILVPLPPINEQKKIVDKLKNINKHLE